MINSENIKPPATYAEWVTLLDKLLEKTNDTDVLSAMKSGTLAWQTGVAERFSQKLINTINARMNLAADKFGKDLNRGQGQEAAIIQAVSALRREMAFLLSAVDLPVIPETDRGKYRALVREQADSMQKSLEDSAKRDRTGKMSSLIRNHKVNSF
jgi:hypothetical protein